ncbi:MAG: hypothetical protein HC793_04430 [Aquincola sp.]|nr:hypothetical protein [Aquincola sp.]
MAKKPRVVSAAAAKLAEMIDQAVDARVGPNATFEERQDAAAAVAADVLVEFRKLGAPGSKGEV